MPKLKWNVYDFVECLGVLPEIDDYETGHHFTIEKDDLNLVLSIWQYDGLFQISLYQSKIEIPIISFYLAVRDEVKYINDKRGSYLTFQNCSVVASDYPLAANGKFQDGNSNNFLTMELTIEPHINIRFIS